MRAFYRGLNMPATVARAGYTVFRHHQIQNCVGGLTLTRT